MKLMLKRIPADLPLFGSLACALGFLAYGLTATLVDFLVSRPSSTAAISLLFLPVLVTFLGGIGYLIGAVVRFIWRQATTAAEPPKESRALQLILVAIILVASLYGAARVFMYEVEAKPSIIVDTGVITSSFRANSGTPVRGSDLAYWQKTAPETISWGENESDLTVNDLHVRLKDRRQPISVDITTIGLDYVTYIHAAHFAGSSSEDTFLALVITGRATGRLAMVVVVNSEYKIVYQQRVECFWNFQSLPLEIRIEPENQKEVAVIGPTGELPLVLEAQ